MERRGTPTVTFAHKNFEQAARAQAKALGMPTLPLAIIEQPRPWHDEAFHAEEAERCTQEIVELLAPAKEIPAR